MRVRVSPGVPAIAGERLRASGLEVDVAAPGPCDADALLCLLTDRVEAALPRFVVVEFVREKLKPWALRFLDSGYSLVGVVDMTLDHTEYLWKQDIDLTRPNQGWVIAVWERREP